MDQIRTNPIPRRDQISVGDLIRRIEQLEAEVDRLRRQVAVLQVLQEEASMRTS